MPLLEALHIDVWISTIEMIGGLIIVGYAIAAALALARRQGLAEVRLLIAQGSITGLSFKLAATLLKTIIIHSWQQIGVFAAILALRIILKWVFTGEERQLKRSVARTRKAGVPA